jgi:hypothetical protein
MPEWINVNERMPNIGDEVYVLQRDIEKKNVWLIDKKCFHPFPEEEIIYRKFVATVRKSNSSDELRFYTPAPRNSSLAHWPENNITHWFLIPENPFLINQEIK